MSKEYTYDIDKYTIGVDENGEDGIGMTFAKIENGEINFLGNCYGENARCIDLLIKENKQLKEELEWAIGIVEHNRIISEKNKEIHQLKDNWDKLRKWIVYNKHNENTEQHYLVVDYGTLLGKMQEIEQGSDD